MHDNKSVDEMNSWRWKQSKFMKMMKEMKWDNARQKIKESKEMWRILENSRKPVLEEKKNRCRWYKNVIMQIKQNRK